MPAVPRAGGRDLAMKARSSRGRKLVACQALYKIYQILSNNPESQQEAYQQLLQAGSDGSGLRRLVARLIPKFAPHFPADLDKSVQALAQVIKAEQAEGPGSTATLFDALQGLGTTCAQLCKVSPGHAAVQESMELLFRHYQTDKTTESSESTDTTSRSAAAGLCSLFKAHPRSCCLACLQIMSRCDDLLRGSVCRFLHGSLLAPSCDHATKTDPDFESDDPDRLSLAQEAFEQPDLAEFVRTSAEGLSGSLAHAAEWQKLLQQVVSQLLPPETNPSFTVSSSAQALASPERTSSIDMAISPPPLPPASRLSPARKQSPAQSRGSRGSSGGRSHASRSPRLPIVSGRVQKRTSSSLRPRDTDSPNSAAHCPMRSPPRSPRGPRRMSPHPNLNSMRSGGPLPWRGAPTLLEPDQGRRHFPKLAPGITAVTRCIWFGNLPPNIPEAELFREANLIAEVQFVILLDSSSRDEALVVFASFGGALLCWERMNGQSVFGGRPITLRFCGSEPQDPRADWRHEPPPPAHVFVPEVTSVGGEAAVFRDLDVGHAPRPEHSDIIRSAGAAGLLMRFSRPAMVPDVLQALDSASRPALPGVPGPRFLSPPHGASPAHSLGRSPSRSDFDRGPPEAGSQPPGRPAYPRQGPAPPARHEKTVWIGQLNSRVSEQELLGAFRQFGNVIDYTIKRNTHCAYIDYDDSHSATLARRAMNGTPLGGSALRVEFKGQHSNSAPPRRELSPRGRGRPARMLSPRGRARGAKAPWDQRPSPSRYGHSSPPPSPRRSPRASRDRHPYSSSAEPYPPHPSTAAPSQAPSHNPTPAFLSPQSPTQGTSSEARPAVAAAAVVGRLPERDSSRGDKISRVRSREASKEELAADVQPGKRARISKWDQLELSPQGANAPLPSQAKASPNPPPPGSQEQIASPPPPLPTEPSPPLLNDGTPSSIGMAPLLSQPQDLTPKRSLDQTPGQTQQRLAATTPSAYNSGHFGPPPDRRHEPHHQQSSSGLMPQLRTASLAVAPRATEASQLNLPAAWEGQLAKTGVVRCKARCLAVGGADAPLQWPAVLDVRSRCETRHALDLHNQPKVAVQCLVSTNDPKNQQPFHDFCEELTKRERAGVVKLPLQRQQLLLIPGCPRVLQQLHMSDPGTDCLVVMCKPL